MRKIGIHVSIAGGVFNALNRAKKLNINTIQIFLKNSNRWEAPQYKDEDIEMFLTLKAGFDEISIFAHSGYLINLAGEGENLRKTTKLMVDELKRADLLKIEYLVVHPGNHKGMGEDKAIRKIARTLDVIFEKTGQNSVKVLLETTSGQGTSIGYRFEHLQKIIDKSAYGERLYICLDTCHIFAAGYDISSKTGYINVMKEFDRIIGLDKLKLIHLNDSKKESGSRVDRHEHIGKGLIGDTGLKSFLNDEKILDIPIILETPKFNDDEADRMNLDRTLKMII